MKGPVISTVFGAMLVSLLLAGCSFLAPLPKPTTEDERLAAMPTKDLPVAKPVTISWDDHQVPFIEAETDEDLAFAL
ncbi:MAG: hypothetical protein ACM3N5_12460, partial [Candidatus Eiseniibacteriota bacterium]